MKLLFTVALGVAVLAGPVWAQSADDGKNVFRKCSGCHKIGANAKNSRGPVLSGVVGRAAGTFSGYKYSKSMLAAGAAGLIWTEDNIFSYLADPTGFLRSYLGDSGARAKMAFRLKNDGDRRDVIAFLATFESVAAPIPGTGFCIVNASERSYLFATETREGERQVSSLAPGARLCAQETTAENGVVTVYDGVKDYEGCNRIVPVGSAEAMLEYAESGRCGWGSHNS